jgi:hypothetical protein
MSGSPVYVDGKIIGAVAYSFPFSKEAIAGITPIGEMLDISGSQEKPSSLSAPVIPFQKSLTLDDLMEIHKGFFSFQEQGNWEGQVLRPLGVPLILSGFSSRVIEKARPFFSKAGFYPVKGGSQGQAGEKPLTPSELTLREGDPVVVQLIGGDLDASALGTVTYVDGNKILAFGHPLYNLGSVDYAMAKANVVAVVPSLENSFKLSNTDVLVGKFSQDRTGGTLGELGKMPQQIPLNVSLADVGEKEREFKLKIVNDKILGPYFTNVALMNLFMGEERSYGDLTLELEGDIYLDNGWSVHVEDLYSGNFDEPVTELAGLVTAISYFLGNNEFKAIGIHRIDLKVNIAEEVMTSLLEKVWLDKYEVSPGQNIQVKVYFRTYRREGSLQQEVSIPVPNLPSGSEFQLIIGDAASMAQIEMWQYRTQGIIPRNLNQLIRLLNNLRKNNRVYFKVIAPRSGLFLRGEELPNLPPTMKSMFTSPRAAASAPTELTLSTLNEYQLAVPFVFKGMAVVPIKIRK